MILATSMQKGETVSPHSGPALLLDTPPREVPHTLPPVPGNKGASTGLVSRDVPGTPGTAASPSLYRGRKPQAPTGARCLLYGRRPTPPRSRLRAGLCSSGSSSVASGRQSGTGTSPGSTSSVPSKNCPMVDTGRTVITASTVSL